ncbi:hypothetical protein [Kribbella kalugense]|uniref:hypothetical protein n=1 Tax=Kribbella kalugense TaxID=2512221 RepID=UPI0010646B52|nr:hypothetical protein [Kribbella kalugense]
MTSGLISSHLTGTVRRLTLNDVYAILVSLISRLVLLLYCLTSRFADTTVGRVARGLSRRVPALNISRRTFRAISAFSLAAVSTTRRSVMSTAGHIVVSGIRRSLISASADLGVLGTVVAVVGFSAGLSVVSAVGFTVVVVVGLTVGLTVLSASLDGLLCGFVRRRVGFVSRHLVSGGRVAGRVGVGRRLWHRLRFGLARARPLRVGVARVGFLRVVVARVGLVRVGIVSAVRVGSGWCGVGGFVGWGWVAWLLRRVGRLLWEADDDVAVLEWEAVWRLVWLVHNAHGRARPVLGVLVGYGVAPSLYGALGRRRLG